MSKNAVAYRDKEFVEFKGSLVFLRLRRESVLGVALDERAEDLVDHVAHLIIQN